MQLLIDSTQETPASLRFIAATLCALADTYGPPLDEPKPSINGPSSPIVLHTHGPAAPIDAVVQARPAVVTQLDPATVFSVPAGTTTSLGCAGCNDSTWSHRVECPKHVPLAPPAPTAPSATNVVHILSSAGLPASAPPAPLTTLSDASDATTIAGTTAPAAPVVTLPSAPTATLDRDSDGLPWDARVHSETRKLNADNTWRYRRNLDPLVKATITAELRAAFPKLVNTGQMSLAPPAPALVAPPAPVAPQPPAPPLPVSDGVPLGLPNATLPAQLPALGFRDFMSAVTKAQAGGRLTQDQLTNACKAVNLDGISALASEPGKISLVHSQIAHLLGAPTA